MRKAWAAVIGLMLAGAASIASAAETSPALRKVIDAAQKEGEITLTYGALLGGTDGARTMERLVNAKYGTHLKIDYTPGPSAPEMAARIAQEQAAKRPSSTDLYPVSMTAANAHLFQAIDWRELVPELPEAAMKFGRRGVAYATLLVGITYNTGLIPEDKAPKTLKDLLDPQWKGKIGVRVSTTFMAFLALPSEMGPEGSVAFFRKLGAQASGMIRCGNAERIASGEFPLFFPNCGDYEARKAALAGAKVGAIIPTDAACMAYFTAGIPNNSAHPNAARLLIAFLLSREGQDFEWDADGADYHGLPGSKIAAVMAKYRAQGVNFIDEVDVEEQHPELLDVQKRMLEALQESMTK
ncbi:MAG TPA: ABC transporter substrate-binding protein [Stellaceae bacterium]|nr:ABC transporter substrate-binding protein [Stellaceae bacterium]